MRLRSADFALVSPGRVWARMVAAAQADTALHRAKRDVVAFFAWRMLPQAHGLALSIAAGEQSVMAMPVDAF